MAGNRDIIEAIRTIAGKDKPQTILGIVVNILDTYCEVEPLNGEANIMEARYAIDTTSKTIYKPKKGSLVSVTMFAPSAGVITSYSELEEISLNGSNYGGLVIGANLVQKLNTIEADINNLKAIFASWVVVPTDGGAALKAALSGYFT